LKNGPTREISVYFARAIVLQFYGILFSFGFYGVFNLFEDVAEKKTKWNAKKVYDVLSKGPSFQTMPKAPKMLGTALNSLSL